MAETIVGYNGWAQWLLMQWLVDTMIDAMAETMVGYNGWAQLLVGTMVDAMIGHNG